MTNGNAARTISAYFGKDHDEIDALLTGVDFSDAREALPKLEEFDRRLERHIVWEEEILFPAAGRAEACLGQGPIPMMLHEHVGIRACKREALELLRKGDGAGALAKITQMLAILGPHNMKEERVLYPACDELIPAAEAAKVLDSVRSAAV